MRCLLKGRLNRKGNVGLDGLVKDGKKRQVLFLTRGRGGRQRMTCWSGIHRLLDRNWGLGWPLRFPFYLRSARGGKRLRESQVLISKYFSAAVGKWGRTAKARGKDVEPL